MRYLTFLLLALTAFCCSARSNESPATQPGSLTFAAAIPLDVNGRIDHLAIDPAAKRLYVAALGNKSVEIIDLDQSKVIETLRNLPTPQGIAVAPDLSRFAIACEHDGTCRIHDAANFKELSNTKLGDDADNVRYDPATQSFWVGFGDGALTRLDARSGKKLAGIKLAGHPESFQLESKGKRIFVNVPSAGHVAVVDREQAKVIAKWPLKDAGANFPMSLDESSNRLFVACRKPARLLVFDTTTGAITAAFDIVADADDLFFDPATSRLYITGGEGRIDVIQRTGDTYKILEKIPTAPGARTALFSPDLRTLFLAVPKRDHQKSELRLFRASTAD